MSTEKITVQIRCCGKDGDKSYRQYMIPIAGETSVLNTLQYVHERLDPTVAYRSSCRRGVCGACMMMIDGQKRLACETRVMNGMKIDPFPEGGTNE